MARLGGFDAELRQAALFDAAVVPEGWVDDTLVGAAGGGAAALQANIAGSGAATGALTTAIRCAAAIVGGAVLTASLTTSIQAAAAVTSSATVTASLTTQIKLAANAAGSGALSASLTTGIPLAAAVGLRAGTITDSFTRANENPIAGNWTNDAVSSPPLPAAWVGSELNGGMVWGLGANSNPTYWNTAVGADCFSQAKVYGMPWPGVFVRLQPGQGTAYFFMFPNSHEATLYRFVGGSNIAALLDFDITGAPLSHALLADGDTIRLEAEGTGATVALRLFINGTLIGSYDDTSVDRIVAPGFIGIHTDGVHSSGLDDFEGGPLVAASAALTTGIPLAAAVNGSGAVSASLATAIRLGAAINGSTALTADLTTSGGAAGLAANVTSASALTAALSTGIRCAAAVAGSATLAAPLTTGIPLAAAVSGSATAAAALTTQIKLAAAVSGTGVPAAALTTAIRLAASVTGGSTLSAALGSQAAALDIVALKASATPKVLIPASSLCVNDYARRVLADGAKLYLRLGDAPGTTAPADASGNGSTSVTSGPVVAFGQSGALADASTSVFINARQGGVGGITVTPSAAVRAINGSRAYSQEVWVNLGLSAPATGLNLQMDLLSWQDPNIHGTLSAFSELAADSSTGVPFWMMFWNIGNVVGINHVDAVSTDVLVNSKRVALATIPTFAWTHVVMTYDGLTQYIYINGVLTATRNARYDAGGGAVAFCDKPLQLGWNTSALLGTLGNLDEFAVYGYQLSSAQIAAHYALRLQLPFIKAAASATSPILLSGSLL